MHLSQHWQIHKPAVHSQRGVVVSQNAAATRAGAAILARGGNAVDAAVAACVALTVSEPWMSGIGGGGFMLVHRAADQTTHAVDFGLVAPVGLDPARYALASGADADMFGWPRVTEDRNLIGYESMCVPGAIDGLALALETFGSLSWAEALAPAIELADQGLAVDWFATLALAHSATDLARFATTRAVLMPQGLPPAVTLTAEPPRLVIPALAATLRRLAQAGPRDFYEGEIARSIVADVAAGGGALSTQDLATYRARVLEPLSFTHGEHTVHTMDGLSGGPTLADALKRLSGRLRPGAALDGAAYAAWAGALGEAYARRLATMGHAAGQSCTSHLNVVDAAGNMVSLTNTLLARFGSKVILPGTGLFMNNGMMWFDPRPGRPNSIAPGQRPLANMCPAILTRGGQGVLALGAAGGRQIASAVTQLISLIADCGLDLEAALHQPRIDVSGGPGITYDERLPEDVARRLRQVAPATPAQAAVFPVRFAVVSGASRDPQTGLNSGQADPQMPLSLALEAGL